MQNNLGNAMTDLVLGDDDDDGEAAVMEDSDLENEEDEVAVFLFYLRNQLIFIFFVIFRQKLSQYLIVNM